MKLLLLGATGLVGGHVLDQALTDTRIATVIAPVRRRLAIEGAEGAGRSERGEGAEGVKRAERADLIAPIVDFDALPTAADWWQADAVICALGTTIRTAGTREAFRRVDHDYPLAVATLAHQHGTTTWVQTSAIGADPSSAFFYSRVKGDVEQALTRGGFGSLTFVRPGLIGGEREQPRPGERWMAAALNRLAPVLPRRFRVNPAPIIARALLQAAIAGDAGLHIVTSDALV